MARLTSGAGTSARTERQNRVSVKRNSCPVFCCIIQFPTAGGEVQAGRERVRTSDGDGHLVFSWDGEERAGQYFAEEIRAQSSLSTNMECPSGQSFDVAGEES